jgi:hypothetical protein
MFTRVYGFQRPARHCYDWEAHAKGFAPPLDSNFWHKTLTLCTVGKERRMQIPKRFRWLSLVVALLLLASLPAFSQGCALCYTQAASSGARVIAALRSGILVLVVPPMFMCAGITVVAYRKRNQFHDTDARQESDERW